MFLAGKAALKYGKMLEISGNDGTLLSAEVTVGDTSTHQQLFVCFVGRLSPFSKFTHLLFSHLLV